MRSTIWIALLVVSSAGAFALGATIGRKSALTDFTNQTSTWDAKVSFGRYLAYRDIAVAIDGGQYDQAKCSSEALASAMFDDVKKCVADPACRPILQNAEKLAPETVTNAKMPFQYVTSASGSACRR